ncbi:MAG: hypothetical protein LBE04_00235, partial [Prevotellaceae bacterium]|nr:hypothetical protein [Prevotellaceae bacterium]
MLYPNHLTPDHALKIASDNVTNGVYFVSQTTSERTRVDESDIVTNGAFFVLLCDLVFGLIMINVLDMIFFTDSSEQFVFQL